MTYRIAIVDDNQTDREFLHSGTELGGAEGQQPAG